MYQGAQQMQGVGILANLLINSWASTIQSPAFQLMLRFILLSSGWQKVTALWKSLGNKAETQAHFCYVM